MFPELRDAQRWLGLCRERLYDRALLSLMVQYTPNPRAPARPEAGQAVPSGRVSTPEYEQVLRWLEELGIEEGFIQEPESDSDWLPDFCRPNPFPREKARVLWHFADGPPV